MRWIPINWHTIWVNRHAIVIVRHTVLQMVLSLSDRRDSCRLEGRFCSIWGYVFFQTDRGQGLASSWSNFTATRLWRLGLRTSLWVERNCVHIVNRRWLSGRWCSWRPSLNSLIQVWNFWQFRSWAFLRNLIVILNIIWWRCWGSCSLIRSYSLSPFTISLLIRF